MTVNRRLAMAFGPLLIAHLALVAIGDLAARVVPAVVVLALASLALWNAARSLRRLPLAPSAVIAGALLLRVVLLPLAPTLSDDVLRYVWDGRVAAAGFNPYALTPEAQQLEPLRDALWERLPHRDVATVYPPLALSLFALASQTAQPVIALKMLLVLADLLTCWLLLVLARRLAVPRSAVVLYAWNPVVVLEIAGMGHVDALGVLAVAAAVVMLAGSRRSVTVAAVAAAAGALAKVVPLLAWPAWARASRRPALFLGVAIGVLVIAALPVVIATGGVPSGYIRFGVAWEFNGPLFEPLWRVLDQLGVPGLLAGALDGAKELTGWHRFWNQFYPFNYPQLLAKAMLALLGLPLLARAWRIGDPGRAAGACFGVLLLISATVYPWYLLWVLPWAALFSQRAWLLLAALLPLSYVPQFLDVELFPTVFCVIWVPFFLLLAHDRRWFAN